MIINPYAEVNWETDTPVPGITHAHCRRPVYTQALIDRSVPNLGEKFFLCMSNYYPSSPTYPLLEPENLRDLPEREKSLWCANDAEMAAWNGVGNVLPASLREYVEALDQDIPGLPGVKYSDVIVEAPNAEHHNFRVNGSDPMAYNRWHMNSVGSMYATGWAEKDEDADHQPGARIEWQDAIDGMLENLLYEDGGGVTINHPLWSGRVHLPFKLICEALDYDPRVLGVEIYSDGDRYRGRNIWTNSAIADSILATGRRCWLFAVTDHAQEVAEERQRWLGINVLLVPVATQHELLKAYRDGRFYAKLRPDTALKFTGISFDGGSIRVTTTNAERIRLVLDGREMSAAGPSASWNVTGNHVYCRVIAQTGQDYDYILSNPIMLGGTAKKQVNDDIILLMG